MKQVNESGINQRLAVSGAIWGGIAECALREERWFLAGLCLCRVLRCFDVVFFLQRVGKRAIHCEVRTWYAIAVGCPGAEVGELASFRAEGAPGIALPRGGLVTEGAGHVRQYIMPNLRIGQRLTRLDLGRGGDLQ